MSSPAPCLELIRAACLKCGATTVIEAETLCRQSQDETGEWYCTGGNEIDGGGFLVQASPAYLARLDAWIDQQTKALP